MAPKYTLMTRAPQEFKEQSLKLNITKWITGACSMCDYPLGFYFSNGRATYDNGCRCTVGTSTRRSDFDEVSAHYNMQNNRQVIAEMDTYWGFNSI